MNPIFRIHVRGLSARPEEEMRRLHQDLVASVVALDCGVKNKNQLFIWFHQDLRSYGLDSEIEIEVDALTGSIVSNSTAARRLLTTLGNIMLSAYPSTYVFCHMPAYAYGDPSLISWQSSMRTNQEELKEVRKLVLQIHTRARLQAATSCYCAANATDHRGACHYHNQVAAYGELVELGERAFAGRESPNAQTLADTFIATCRARTMCVELHKEMGWSK